MSIDHILSKSVMKYIAPTILIILLLCVGIGMYKNYGVHYDGVNNLRFGNKWLSYVENSFNDGELVKLDTSRKFSEFNRDFIPIPNQESKTILISEHDLSHGPVFEILLAYAAKIFKIENSKSLFQFRNFTNFILFILTVLIIYILGIKLFGKWYYASLCSLFLVLHPRILGSSFFNTVDIPFLSFYLLGTLTMIMFLDKRSYINALLHGAVCAIAVDIRLAGIILVCITFLFLFIELIRARQYGDILKKSIVYLIVFFVFVVLFWPLLWTNPLNILEAFNHSTIMEKTGRVFRQVDWRYNFLWIFYTTPLVYIFFFVLGFFKILLGFFKDPADNYSKYRDFLLIILLISLPILLPILFDTRLFHGWRHHYFIYPGIVLISIFGVSYAIDYAKSILSPQAAKITTYMIFILIFINSFFIARFIYNNHPIEYIYVNSLGVKNLDFISKDWPLEYWDLGDKEILEYLLKNDNADFIDLNFRARDMNHYNLFVFNERDKKRFRFNKIKRGEKRPHYLILRAGSKNKKLLDYLDKNYYEFHNTYLLNRKNKTIYKSNPE